MARKEIQNIHDTLQQALDLMKGNGADHAQASLSTHQETEVKVRNGVVESLETSKPMALDLYMRIGDRSESIELNSRSAMDLHESVAQLAAAVRRMPDNTFDRPVDPSRISRVRTNRNLDLIDRARVSLATMIEDARAMEAVALSKYKADAGARWAYHIGPYTLLDQVIEKASNRTMNQYLTQKIKNTTGMDGIFIKQDYNNVYFSTARSMARFGLLILNKGNWNGTQILTDQKYYNDMVNTSQNINESYGYLWWLNGKNNFMVPGSQIKFPGSFFKNAPSDMFSALGKNGQFINVIPSQNMVWIRMGDNPDNALVPFLFNEDVWDYINALACTSSTSESTAII